MSQTRSQKYDCMALVLVAILYRPLYDFVAAGTLFNCCVHSNAGATKVLFV